jgi:hypothetical protein
MAAVAAGVTETYRPALVAPGPGAESPSDTCRCATITSCAAPGEAGADPPRPGSPQPSQSPARLSRHRATAEPGPGLNRRTADEKHGTVLHRVQQQTYHTSVTARLRRARAARPSGPGRPAVGPNPMAAARTARPAGLTTAPNPRPGPARPGPAVRPGIPAGPGHGDSAGRARPDAGPRQAPARPGPGPTHGPGAGRTS